jgi:hypothetical protein
MDIEQCNIPLAPLYPTEVAARYSALKRKPLLGPILCLSDFCQALPEQDTWVGSHWVLRLPRTLPMRPLSGHAL